ncbi:MAG: hypothetical protein AAF483_06825 [Planctomycetota bacterium]
MCVFRVWLLLTVVLAGNEALAQDEISPSECASMLKQVADCCDSVTSYDLLLEFEKNEEGDGIADSFKVKIRIVCDYEEKRLASALLLSQDDPLRRRSRSAVRSQFIRDGNRLFTEFVSAPKRMPAADLNLHLNHHDIPNFKMVGFAFFPSVIYDSKEISKTRGIVLGALATHGVTTLKGRTVSVKARVPLKDGEAGRRFSVREYKFDLATSLPTNFSCSFQHESDGKISSTPRYSSVIEWCEPTPGIRLPESLFIVEHGLTLRDPNIREIDQLVKTKTTTEVKFNWFSVNDRIDPKAWDEERWMDYASARKLCELEDEDSSP